MIQEVTNFSQFYTLLRMLPGADKETLVHQYTGGRTTHLREMTAREYKLMCRDMSRICDDDRRREILRKKRSVCLRLMQQMGVDTGDWARVNSFCQNSRIAGKEFARISMDDLELLAVKLRAIKNNGGLRQKATPYRRGGAYVVMSIGAGGEA